MHFVVADYVESAAYPLAKLRELLEKQQDPFLGVLLQMMEAVVARDQDLIAEARAAADRTRPPDDVSSDLHLFFLVVRCRLAANSRRSEEVLSLAKRIRSASADEVPKELFAATDAIEAQAQATVGNYAEAERLVRRATDNFPRESRHWGMNFSSLARLLCMNGRGTEAREGFRAAAKLYPREFTAAVIASFRFIDSVETGRIREADRLLHELSGLSPHTRAMNNIDTLSNLLDLMADRWKPEPAPAREDGSDWAYSTWALLNRDPDEALRRARAPLADGTAPQLAYARCIGFGAYTLIRAELAAGNADAARRLLWHARDAGKRHYLDDFFLARIELIAGSREAAAWHFGRAVASCERYAANARLEFELRLAPEVSAADVLVLSRGSRTEPAERLEIAAAGAPVARGCERLLGTSQAMRAVRETIAKMAALDVPVLITGETGTGKELVAHALHEEGPRGEAPFIAVNCGAISEALLESELFGHARGAFTGAVGEHRGLFEEAGAGVILLDEIGEMPPRLQVALLRVLETGEVRPVGSSAMRRLRCRVLAATNADLAARSEAGTFRKDLYFRLKRLTLHLPPLNERPEDIVSLATHFLSEDRADGRRPELTSSLREALERAPWPGNVRELRNVMERMRLLSSRGASYDLADIDPTLPGSPTPAPGRNAEAASPSAAAGREKPIEREEIAAFLGGQRSALRRRDRLRDLFREHRKMTRVEIAKLLDVSLRTASRDLKALCTDGYIQRVEPTPSPRTHYFQLRDSGDSAQ